VTSVVGDVYSIAGNGTVGTSGDNAQATEAELNIPVGMTMDASGNIYVGDESNNRVQEIAGTTHTQFGISMTAGDVYTIAGSSSGTSGSSGDGGAATSALLTAPSGVTVDASGNVYIEDQQNNRIQEIAVSTGSQWGISMTANDIYTIAGSSSGTSGSSGDGGPATSALLDNPRNLAFDAAGNIYFDDTLNNRIQFIAASNCSSSCPWGLASTTANDIYTIAGSSSGTSGSSGDGAAATSALLDNPKGITLDASGNLYFGDSLNNRVQEVAASTSTQWGQSMTANDIYTMAGSSSGTAGHSGDGGAATSALLSAPRAVVFDSAGDLFIADGTNNRVQEVSASTSNQWGQSMTAGDVYTIAGSSSGTSGSSGDGGAATSALFNLLGAIAIDSSGDILVADENNSEIREITAPVLAPTLPNETSGGGNPAQYSSHPATSASTSQGEGLSVDAITGALSNSVTDLSVPGSGIPIDLTRTYDSARASILGPLGYGWTDSYNMSLAAGTGSLSNTEQVTQENGSVAYFYQNTQGGWTSPARQHATLVYNSANSTWTFTRNKTSIFTFNSSGQLISETNPNGYTTSLTYGPNGLLKVTADVEVGSGVGAQTLIFSYGTNGLVSEATTSTGRSVMYTYDGSSQLTGVAQSSPGQQAVGDLYSMVGNGTAGSSGDNAQATEAQLNAAVSTSEDSAGNIYIADRSNNRVQELAATTHTQFAISMTAGDIYTIAGSSSGTAGHSGNGGVATSALLDGPAKVLVDGSGNVYIGDDYNNRVQFIAAANCSSSCPWGLASTTANDIYTIAGSSSGTSGSSGNGGAATSALFSDVRNIALDAAGNLYVADQNNNRIQFVAKSACSSACAWGLASTTANDVYTIAGSSSGSLGHSGDGGAATSALFSGPTSVSFDTAGNMYVADGDNNRIQFIAASTCSSSCPWGLASTTANDVYTIAGSSSGTSGSSGGGGVATSALLNEPRDAVVDASGNLYFADENNNRIEEVAVVSGTQWGQSMTADHIYTIAGNSAGTSGSSGDGGAGTSALLNLPAGLSIDATGNLFITDENNNEVRELIAQSSPGQQATGDLYSILGNGTAGTSGDNAQATEAEIHAAVSTSVDSVGNIYIADRSNNRVQEIAATTHTQFAISMTAGDVYTIAGSASGTVGHSGNGGVATSALLDGPAKVLVDGSGNVYIGEDYNNRVQYIAAATCSSNCPWGLASTTANDIYTIAGSSVGTSGSSGDGGAATSALFNNIRSIALDAAGNLYVADQSNNRIQFVARSSCSSACPWGLASTTANDVYTIVGSSSGTLGHSGDTGPATSALLSGPTSVSFDAAGNMYVADGDNNRIQFIAASTCSSSCPWGLASTTADDVYTIAGSSSGTSGSSGGGGPATSALLNEPRDAVIDAAGNLYYADENNNRIQEVAAIGGTQWGQSMTANDVYTIAGNSAGTSGSSGDGGVGTSALLNLPAGLSIDTTGNLYITDENNNEVRELAHDVIHHYGYTTVGSVSHLLNSAVDSLTASTSFSYTGTGCPASAADCVSSMTDATSKTTNWSYSLNGSGTGTVLLTDPVSADQTQYAVNQYELTSETDGYGTSAAAITETTLDPATGEPWIVRQPTGGLNVSYFDNNGNTTAAIDALGNLTTTTYNTLNEPLVTTAPTGEVTTDAYNADGDLTSQAQPVPGSGTATTSYTYADSAHPDLATSVTDPDSHTTSYTFTVNGLQASVTDPVGNKTTYTYNALDQKSTMVSPRGNVLGGTPANFTTAYFYDPYGNLVETIDPLGHVTSENSNSLGQKLSSTDANGNTTSYAYDNNGRLVT
jgi:YD repeat-containing protein